MLRRLLLTLVVVGISSNAWADSAFDGKWTAEVVRPAPAGNQALTITFSTDKGKVMGSMSIQGAGEVPIEWGMVEGDVITFKIKGPLNNTMVSFAYLGKIDGNQIKFGRRPEDLSLGRPVEFTAKRVK